MHVISRSPERARSLQPPPSFPVSPVTRDVVRGAIASVSQMEETVRVVVRYRTQSGREESRRLRPGVAIDLLDRLERLKGKVLSIRAPGGASWTVTQARHYFQTAVGEDHSRR